MLSENDRQNLLRNLNRNRVVLVTGAGFSMDAENSFNKNLPTSKTLAEALWGYLYDDPYDGKSSLKTLYSVALNHKKGVSSLRQFLYSHLHAEKIPAWYALLSTWYWHRIYTFNIDDVVEQLYPQGKATVLDRIIAPNHFVERDQFLRRLQYIKLHGSLDSPKDLTFGPREYATRAAARADIWYIHFVEDYSTLPTVFIGTELDEPLFWQYVELRGSQKSRGDKVRRPKCFLVAPSVSKPEAEMLEQYNIVAINSTAQKFFEWLAEQQEPATRESVLRLAYEGYEPALEAAEKGLPIKDVQRIEFFLSVFRLPSRSVNPRRSSMFLLGVPPTWDDIAGDVDAHRDFSDELTPLLREMYVKPEYDILHITAPAGGGKSTLSRRAALELVDDGYTVYFSDGTVRPDPAKIADYIFSLNEKVFLFFDNAGDDLNLISEIWDRVKKFDKVPAFVISSRTNDAAFKGGELTRVGANVNEIRIPNLSDADIKRVIETLERHDLLGVLKEKSKQFREHVFSQKAKKQILVAMREATSGRGFDEILIDEYNTVEPKSAKMLYLINALASDDDYGLSMQQMITAMDLAPNETQILIEKNLSGILVQHENDATKYYIRHPAIAHFIVKSAPRDELARATIALMSSLAAVMPAGAAKKNSRAFRLYRHLLSHTEMQSRFHDLPELARSIYEGIKDFYRDDGHYWLHYGAYEVELGGEIGLAENYLDQANSMLVNSKKVDTARAHLLFKKAKYAANSAIADGFVGDALKILRAHLADRANVSLHALTIFGRQMEEYIRRWVPRPQQSMEFRSIYRELQQSVPEHMASHPVIEQVLRDLKRSELETAVHG